ncbi:hypothetical protein C5S53_14360 [Methanophagales archaeon]|nr:hypothetical protein C5S53_14360 [Methanophagales archaeon]
MADQIYIQYHEPFGELVTGHLAMSGLADMVVGYLRPESHVCIA